MGRNEYPSVSVIDSQSVKWGVIDSIKGVDGFKKVKGIKRHIATDSQGFPLAVIITTANIHDSKAGYGLIGNLLGNWKSISLIKGDKGYGGPLQATVSNLFPVELECVKSNFGSSDFIPMRGRWVVERTFSWFDNYRRLTRNYEKSLRCANHVTVLASVAFMIRYIK